MCFYIRIIPELTFISLKRCNLDYCKIIKNNFNGLIGRNVEEIIDLVNSLLNDYNLAKELSENQVKSGRLFLNPEELKKKWLEVFELAFDIRNGSA